MSDAQNSLCHRGRYLLMIRRPHLRPLLAPSVPPHLGPILVDYALAMDALARFRSIEELARELEYNETTRELEDEIELLLSSDRARRPTSLMKKLKLWVRLPAILDVW